MTSTLQASISSTKERTSEYCFRVVLWSLNEIIYKKLAWYLAQNTCLTKVSFLLSSPTSSQPTCTDSKWHSSWLPPWKHFPSENVSVYSQIYRLHKGVVQTLLGSWSFQSKLLFSKLLAVGRSTAGVLLPTLGLWVREIRTSLQWGWWKWKDHHMSFPEGWLSSASVPVPLRFSWKPPWLAQLGVLAHQIPCFGEKCKHRPDFSF